jgi:hypothetical protein
MTGPYSKRGYDGENGPFVKADVETVLAKAEADAKTLGDFCCLPTASHTNTEHTGG